MGTSSSPNVSLSIDDVLGRDDDPGRTYQNPMGDLERASDDDDEDPSLPLLPLEDSDDSDMDLSRCC